MGTPQIPKTQQDALPIQTIAAANGGDLQIVGATLTRQWTFLALGSPAFVNVSTGSILRTPTLDVRGCNRYLVILKRTIVVDAADNYTFGVCFGFSDGTFPLNADLFNTASAFVQGMSMGGFAVGAGAPNPMLINWSWTDPSANWNKGVDVTGNVPVFAVIGSNVQFYILNTNPVTANRTYQVECWGAE